MTRYFVAIPLPRKIRERLALLRANLGNARWIATDDFHLTLRFIGDCDGPTLTDVITELGEVRAEPFSLQLSNIGLFGHDRPRSIWISVAEAAELVDLHNQINMALRKIGLESDGRKFTPHVTLARLSRTNPADMAQALEGLGSPLIAPFVVDSFALYSSGRSRGGGPYAMDETFAFSNVSNAPEEY